MELLIFPQKPRSNFFNCDVPFNDQNDNSPNKGQGQGYRQCFLTVIAMLVKYLKPNMWAEYRDFANGYQDLLYPFGDTTFASSHIQALAKIGIEAYFTTTASMADIARVQYMGFPIPIGTAYKQDGHWVILTGREPGYMISHNPFGERRGTSNEWISIGGAGGKGEILSAAWMLACFVDQGPETGYAVFVTAIDGVPTGVPKGL